MDHPVNERRLDPRFRHAWFEVSRTTLRPGYPVALVDVSAGGALVESPRPLRPGARVHVQLVTEGRTLSLAAHVLRCAVWSVDPDHGVQYRGALRFDQRCELFREEAAPGSPGAGGTESRARRDGRYTNEGPGDLKHRKA